MKEIKLTYNGYEFRCPECCNYSALTIPNSEARVLIVNQEVIKCRVCGEHLKITGVK